MSALPLITLAGQAGAGARATAAAVAARLGVPLLQHEIVSEAAALARVSEDAIAAAEHDPGLFGRLLAGLSQAGPPAAALPSPDAAGVVPCGAAPALRAAVQEILDHLADRGGAVLLGHAAACVLRGRADVLHVFLHAPLAERVRRLMVANNLPKTAAIDLAQSRERERSAYCRRAYRCNRYDLQRYTLTLNTAGRTVDELAQAIVAQAEALAIRRSAAGTSR